MKASIQLSIEELSTLSGLLQDEVDRCFSDKEYATPAYLDRLVALKTKLKETMYYYATYFG